VTITSSNRCIKQNALIALWCKYAAAAFILLVILPTSVFSSTLDDYHSRVSKAVSALDSLSQNDETETQTQIESRVEHTVNMVRLLLPETEMVEWENESVVVQNKWVHEALDDYRKQQGDKAALALRSLTERLRALEQRLVEVKTAESRSGVSGAEASNKLKEILSRPEFGTKKDAGTAFERIWRQIQRWLSSLLPKRRELSPGSANIATLVAQVFVITIALAVILYVLFKLIPRFFRGRARRKKVKDEPRIVLGDKLAPDQSAVDILAEAEALARQGDLRAAIRKAYIALLVELGDRKIVSLAQYKTNRDYLRAVRKKEPLYSNMVALTESFERHWYGFVGATENDWTDFRAVYQRALTR
jgi:uncharacterized protein DUF4129